MSLELIFLSVCVIQGIAGFEQILLALERVERDEDLTYEVYK